MDRQRHIVDRVLRHAEDVGLFFCFLTLLLIETGYVAWLERLPAFPAPKQPDGFLILPPWYGRPRVEVSLLLTVFGGLIVWTAMSLISLLRSKRQSSAKADAQRTIVLQRLKAATFWAIISGADLLFSQLLRS
jgi:uncharacterized iron-regulated membrane protein